MRRVIARRRLLACALGLSLATGLALAAAADTDTAAPDQPPPAVAPRLGEEPPQLHELLECTRPQPRGQRADGTALVRPQLAAPQR